ncbi:MAG: fibrobacter succinogenes major paralogous domain-containing protein [Fibrobacteraceae bacterium]|nr:fibrobacter succinogenes major paralogous domain-containing protein [Fibrobacteraceae bacterium]
MKQKQRIALFGMVAVALIFAACTGDSGNNGTEVEGGSSSSVNTSSSSSVAVSSSSEKVAWDYLNPNITYGEITDTRDGQTYKTVVIGTQTWMAENLNYADSTAMPNLKGNSWCYGNRADSCAKYGRLYTWTAAMAFPATYNDATWGGSDVNHQGVCPSGWHVPTDAEWTILDDFVGGEETAGTKLKSTSGWYNDGNGMNTYGFSALPGGTYIGLVYLGGSGFGYVGYYGYWWTATEYSSTSAYGGTMYFSITDVDAVDYNKAFGQSLRCLKD